MSSLVFDNAVNSTAMYIQQIDLLSLSHRLVEMTNCRRFISNLRLKTQFIVHCCAKIIKSGAGSNDYSYSEKAVHYLGGEKHYICLGLV